MMRAAIIGCGKIASGFADDPLMRGDVFTHAEAYVRCPDTQLAAVADVDPVRARACAERWRVPVWHTSVRALLEDVRPEVVSICTPDETHAQVAEEVLRYGCGLKALLIEKPMALTESDASGVLKLARERGVVLAVDFMRRHARNMQAVRELIRAGRIGTVESIQGLYGKGVLHNAVHWFDLVRMLTGEAAWVEAWNRLGDSETDPTLDVRLGLSGGAVATLAGCRAEAYSVFEMDIVGTRGRFRLTDSCHRVELFVAGPSPRYSGYRELQEMTQDFGHRRDLLLHAVEDLVESLRAGRSPACGGEDGLAAARIAEACLRSAACGQRVELA